MLGLYIILGIVALIIIVGICVSISHSNAFDEDKMSARDYWRWKTGGID